MQQVGTVDEGQSVEAPPAAERFASVPAPGTPGDRYEWMDMSRGLGVMLIALVHAGSIYRDTSGLLQPEWYYALDLAFGPFRVPLLFFLSGVLLQRSMGKGLERFAKGKLQNLLWPYFIWTAVYMLAFEGPRGLLEIRPWLGDTTMWFMSFLIFYFAISVVTARVPVLLVAIYALALSMILPTDTRYGSRLLLMMAFFFCGAYAGENFQAFVRLVKGKWAWAAVPVVLALMIYPIFHWKSLKYNPHVFPLVLAAIISVCAIFNYAARGLVGRAFLFCGRNSVIYYAVHPPVYFVVFHTLYAAGIHSPAVCLPTSFLAGTAVSTVLALLAQRHRAASLLFKSPNFTFGPRTKALIARLERIFYPPALIPARREPGVSPSVAAARGGDPAGLGQPA